MRRDVVRLILGGVLSIGLITCVLGQPEDPVISKQEGLIGPGIGGASGTASGSLFISGSGGAPGRGFRAWSIIPNGTFRAGNPSVALDTTNFGMNVFDLGVDQPTGQRVQQRPGEQFLVERVDVSGEQRRGILRFPGGRTDRQVQRQLDGLLRAG